MQHIIIQHNVLDTSCLVAERYLGLCHTCKLVERCKLEQAKLGRVNLYRTQLGKLIAESREKTKHLKTLLKEAESQIQG